MSRPFKEGDRVLVIETFHSILNIIEEIPVGTILTVKRVNRAMHYSDSFMMFEKEHHDLEIEGGWLVHHMTNYPKLKLLGKPKNHLPGWF